MFVAAGAVKGESKLHAKVIAEEAGGVLNPLSPILDMPLTYITVCGSFEKIKGAKIISLLI